MYGFKCQLCKISRHYVTIFEVTKIPESKTYNKFKSRSFDSLCCCYSLNLNLLIYKKGLR